MTVMFPGGKAEGGDHCILWPGYRLLIWPDFLRGMYVAGAEVAIKAQ